jgi:4'-phosphopantetheinyl transferase
MGQFDRVSINPSHALGPGDVHLWFVRPDWASDTELHGNYVALLSDSERARHGSFTVEHARHVHLVTRALVRCALARYLPVIPRDLRFVSNAWGRPEIDPPSGLRFNASHSSGLIVCAVALAAVGVDVEHKSRSAEILRLAPRVFSSRELAALRHLAFEDHLERALSLWTLKEAYAKARGVGLSLPPEDYSFLFGEPDQSSICLVPPKGEQPGRFAFRTLDHSSHRVAIALDSSGGSAPHLRTFQMVPLVSSSEVELEAC